MSPLSQYFPSACDLLWKCGHLVKKEWHNTTTWPCLCHSDLHEWYLWEWHFFGPISVKILLKNIKLLNKQRMGHQRVTLCNTSYALSSTFWTPLLLLSHSLLTFVQTLIYAIACQFSVRIKGRRRLRLHQEGDMLRCKGRFWDLPQLRVLLWNSFTNETTVM